MISAVEAHINLTALKHNLERVRQAAPNAKIMAVIKANGYGHGMLQVAEALSGVDAFALARLHEAYPGIQQYLPAFLIISQINTLPGNIDTMGLKIYKCLKIIGIFFLKSEHRSGKCVHFFSGVRQ